MKPGVSTWTDVELRLLREAYSIGGINTAMAVLPGRKRKAIQGKASKLGIIRDKYASRACQEEPGRPQAPQRYISLWEPLKPEVAPPRRAGADDFRKVLSLTTNDETIEVIEKIHR